MRQRNTRTKLDTGLKSLHCTLDIYRENRHNQIYKGHDYSDPNVVSIWNSKLLFQRMFNAF